MRTTRSRGPGPFSPQPHFSGSSLCPWARRTGRATTGSAGGAGCGDQDQAPGEKDLLVGDCPCLCCPPATPALSLQATASGVGQHPAGPRWGGRGPAATQGPTQQADTPRGSLRHCSVDALARRMPAPQPGDPGPSLHRGAGWASKEPAWACLPSSETGRALGRYVSCHAERQGGPSATVGFPQHLAGHTSSRPHPQG